MNSERLAIQLMVAQGVLFAAETMTIHHIGSSASIMLLAFLRGAAGVILAVLVARQIGAAVLRTRQLPVQLLRGGVSLLYLWVMIYSFSHLPFADATAISYMQAAYIPIFAVIILRESIAWACWAAAGIGIIGALFIAKPAFTDWNMVYVIALLGTSLNGLAFVLNRHLRRQDTEATTMLYTNIVMALGNLPLLFFAELPTLDVTPWLVGLLVFGPVGMYLGIIAAKHADASVLGPYTLLRLVMSILIGVALFNEFPDAYSLCGVLTILTACMLSSFGATALPQLKRRLG